MLRIPGKYIKIFYYRIPMFHFLLKNKKNRQTMKQAQVRARDSFIVDLRPLIEKQTKTAINIPYEKVVKRINNSKNSSFSVSPEKNEKRNKKFKRQRSYRVSFKSLAAIKFYSWQRKKRLLKDLPLYKKVKKNFNIYNANSLKQLKSTKRIIKKKNKNLKDRNQANRYLLNCYRSIFSFVIVLIIIILPFKILAYFKIIDLPNLKDTVLNKSLLAMENMVIAGSQASNLSWNEATNNFSIASQSFNEAQSSLDKVDDWLLSFAAFSKNSDLKMASFSKSFLRAGLAAAQMGQYLSTAGEVMESEETDKNWGALIDSFVLYGKLAQVEARKVESELADIKPSSLPQKYQAQFLDFQNKLKQITQSLELLLSSADSVKSFLGVSADKRYLLIFQNNTEMRGSGGFLGSYALVDIRNGNIRKLEVPNGGSYDTEAGMRLFIKAPEPLRLVNPRWFFWDANWWPDWPLTAKSLMWFYEKSDGPTVDGVISFTPDVLEDLLIISGEIDLESEYGLTINASNFYDLIQKVVEKPNLKLTYPEEILNLPDSPDSEPKKIIGDLMIKIIEQLPQVLNKENLPALAVALEKNLAAKNILLYFNDEDLQAKLNNFGINGAIKNNEHDYLMVTHTNIAGQKTDRVMEDKIIHETEILADGSVIDNLTIYRAHKANRGDIFSGVRNVDWLRVYVPEGSMLLDASGFTSPDEHYFDEPQAEWLDFPAIFDNEGKYFTDLESATKIYKESGKTVFANWVMTDPGEVSIINFKYRLPLKIKKTDLSSDSWFDKAERILAGKLPDYYQFTLLIQKQPGAKEALYNLSLKLPNFWRIAWNYPKNTSWSGDFKLNRDRFQAVLLEN